MKEHYWPAFHGQRRNQRHQHLQTQCGVNCFILDSRRVLAPAPKVLRPKHISNPDFPPFWKKGAWYLDLRIAYREGTGYLEHQS